MDLFVLVGCAESSPVSGSPQVGQLEEISTSSQKPGAGTTSLIRSIRPGARAISSSHSRAAADSADSPGFRLPAGSSHSSPADAVPGTAESGRRGSRPSSAEARPMGDDWSPSYLGTPGRSTGEPSRRFNRKYAAREHDGHHPPPSSWRSSSSTCCRSSAKLACELHLPPVDRMDGTTSRAAWRNGRSRRVTARDSPGTRRCTPPYSARRQSDVRSRSGERESGGSARCGWPPGPASTSADCSARTMRVTASRLRRARADIFLRLRVPPMGARCAVPPYLAPHEREILLSTSRS